MADVNAEENNRPNIRIQIYNNLTNNENMEVDAEENEDGEIIDFVKEEANIIDKSDLLNKNEKVWVKRFVMNLFYILS